MASPCNELYGGVVQFGISADSPPAFQKEVNLDTIHEEWNTYSVTQRVIQNNTSRVQVCLKKNDVDIASYEMATTKALSLKNKQVKIYLAGPWSEAATGYNVRNFFLEQYD